MRRIEDMCVECTDSGLPCLGSACPNRRKVEVCYCDECKEEIDTVYGVGEEELCKHCFLEKYRKEI